MKRYNAALTCSSPIISNSRKHSVVKSFCSLLIQSVSLLILSLSFLSCSTFPKDEWDANVGALDYDQAVINMGPPSSQATLSDGSIVAEWLLRRGRNQFFVMDNTPGFGMQNITEMGSPDFYLRLVFDENGKLLSWKRVAK